MTDDTIPLFSFPAVDGKKITAAFDGGRMSSDGGVMLLSLAERRLGVAERLAGCVPDRRDPSRIAHTIADNDPRPGVGDLLRLRGRRRSQ